MEGNTIKDAFQLFVDKKYVESKEILQNVVRSEFLTNLKNRLDLKNDIKKE